MKMLALIALLALVIGLKGVAFHFLYNWFLIDVVGLAIPEIGFGTCV